MSLATSDDISARLGRALATGETAAVAFLLPAADSVIAAAADITAGNLDATAHPVLRYVAVEIVCRALANPQGISNLRESLGQYSSSVQFRDAEIGGGLLLSKNEELLVRKAIHGTLTASPRVQGLETDITGGPYVLGS